AYTSAPLAKPGSNQAIEDAIQFAFFHWGIHAWGVYGIVALVMAYFNFHKGYPGLVSATLRPLFGEKRMSGPLGSLLDVLAIIATVTGVAATLGFGALQINQGLNFMFNIKPSFTAQLLIILFSAMVFTWSSWTGISKGIK
ncbi:BCCT family transporter, partial [Staphylococcus equorum]